MGARDSIQPERETNLSKFSNKFNHGAVTQNVTIGVALYTLIIAIIEHWTGQLSTEIHGAITAVVSYVIGSLTRVKKHGEHVK